VLTAERYRDHIEPALKTNPIPGVKFHYVPVPFRLGKIPEAMQYVLWQIAALNLARKLAQSLHFDLAHHVSYGSVHVPSQLWRLGVPLVFGPVGGGQTAPAAMLTYFGEQKKQEQLRTAVTRILRLSFFHRNSLQKMGLILAANYKTLELVQSLGCRNSVLMCDAGLPDNFFALGPRVFQRRDRPLKLLWVGRILPRKGLPLALDAIARVRQPVTLTILGDAKEPHMVRQMIADRKLEDKVVWHGRRLTWSEVRSSYLDHDAMLFTSLRDSFGCQLLEAMALGLPLITLDLHGAHDFVPEGAALKVSVGRPEETVRNLVNAIEHYASSSAQSRCDMSTAGWSFARNFTWTARTTFLEGIYKDILSKTIDLDSVAARSPNAKVPCPT
jgi:glycosyltransferase involved in cell wall biosynthesis